MYENKTKDIIEASSGNKEILEKLMNDNSKLIWSIVIRFKDRGHELQDLYQIGCIGFIKAIKGFDASYDVKLSTYAVPYILGEIKRFIRDDGPIKVSRGIKELLGKIKLLQKEYTNKTGADISIDEISKVLKVSKEDIILAMEAEINPDSIDNTNEDGVSLIDKIKSQENEEEMTINKIIVKELINNLDDNSKKIILLRYFRGKTQSEVANIMKLSQVQVSRLEKRILEKMKSNIGMEKKI